MINYLSAMQNTAINYHICYKCPLVEMTQLAYCKSKMIKLIVECMVFSIFWFYSSTISFIFIEVFCLSLTLPKHKEEHVHCTSTLYATIHFQWSKGSAKTCFFIWQLQRLHYYYLTPNLFVVKVVFCVFGRQSKLHEIIRPIMWTTRMDCQGK